MIPALSVENLTVRYGGFTGLQDLDMDIRAGEIVGVIGTNGAGKTTLVKALCDRVPIASGKIELAGVGVSPGQCRRRHIGFVPQSIALYTYLTARENLAAFGRFSGLSRRQIRQRTVEVLQGLDMMAHADKRVSEMSGGMARRINVACAVIHDPALLILDEPTAGVDMPACDLIHRTVRDIARMGIGVCLITHELDAAESLCGRILLLQNGKRLAFETPASMLSGIYGDERRVTVRFAQAPSGEVVETLRAFSFVQNELDTDWSATTLAGEVSFVSAFMGSMPDGSTRVTEIGVRRPGLNALVHALAARTSLPAPEFAVAAQ